MEKNQHNQYKSRDHKHNSGYTGNQPGQQLPDDQNEKNRNDKVVPEEKIKHSESSFPKQEDETLGTP